MNKKILTLLMLLLLFSPHIRGAEGDSITRKDTRPIMSVYSIEVGKHYARSTYLSPCVYQGVDWSIAGRWGKRLPFAPNAARMDFDCRISLWPQLLNPAGYVAMQGFNISVGWQMSWFKNISDLFTLSVGGGPELSGGLLMLMRNSNNPVSVDLDASLTAGVALTRDFKIGRLPVTAEWRLSSPVIGAFFMPEYGETYYEIYLGNRRGLVHCGWPGNMFRLNSLAAIRLDFGKTAMQIGYRFITDSHNANHLSNHQITHAFSIGIIPHGLGKKRALSPCP